MIREDCLNTFFKISNSPNWSCPSCNKGIIKLKKEDLKLFETRESYFSRIEFLDALYPTRYRFSSFLTCSDKECQDTVIVTGNAEHDIDDVNTETGVQIWELYIFPQYFNPSLEIIKVESNYPEKIQSLLKSTFELFWIDLSSCANKIRTTLEVLLDQQKIKKITIKNRKKTKLTLDARISLFGNSRNQQVSDILKAIKWIGNEGSHSSNIDRKSVLMGFKLLEYCLDEIFPARKKEILRVAKQINKHKKYK
ncbi:MAG: DUF4145 domain-containing protein [Saprospiraceae bacterium]|nr:DUF4145 domain-containing protein [Saprospiraceae bacterium]